MPAGKGRISVFAGHRASHLSWIGRRRTGRPVGSGPTFHAYSPSPRQRTGWCCPTIADRTDALPRVIGPVGIAGTASRSRTRRARRAGDIPGRYPGRYPGPRQGAEGGCVASKGAAPKLTIRTSLRASARVLGQPGIFSRQHPGDPYQPDLRAQAPSAGHPQAIAHAAEAADSSAGLSVPLLRKGRRTDPDDLPAIIRAAGIGHQPGKIGVRRGARC
jgi:hypothetical protein